MSIQNKLFIVLILIISAYFVLIWKARDRCWEDRYWGLKILQDDDRNDYYERGLWLIDKTTPYKTSFQEYPQLATYLFALPHIFRPNLSQYRIIFSGIMVVIFLITIFVLFRIIKLLNGDYKNLLILVFPSMLYFSFNRFDLLPMVFSILSLLLILKGKNILAFFILGLAIMTKWYPIIYVPLFLNYIYKNQQSSEKKCITLIKPILVLLFTIGFVSLPTILWAGIDGFLSPYKFHWQRGDNGESLFYFLKFLLNTPTKYHFAKHLFFILQFISIPILLIMSIRKKEELIISMGIATLFFIVFAKYHSPQWLIWVSPILLLIKDRFIFVLLSIYDLSTYAYFPLGSDLSYRLFGNQSLFEVLIFFNLAIKVFIIFWLFKRLHSIKIIQPDNWLTFLRTNGNKIR